MNEKVEGEKLIKEALRKDIKNPTVWHFYAIYYKQEKYLTLKNRNYSQSMKSYKCALMYDPTNTVILRDLTYLQLQLRQISAFSESAKKALELKSNIMVNWVTFSVAHYLTGNYSLAYKAIDSCKSMQETNLKEQEKNEIILYEALLLQKQKKYNEIITLLEANQK
jgi:peptide alpha-N-acetyltransferase